MFTYIDSFQRLNSVFFYGRVSWLIGLFMLVAPTHDRLLVENSDDIRMIGHEVGYNQNCI